MPAISGTLGSLTFKTKGAREAHIKERIRGLVYQEKIRTIAEGEPFQFLCDVLAQHPDYERKRGCGVRAFCLEQSWDGKGVHTTLPRDDAFRNNWRAFHNQNANLQVLCAACNNKKRDNEA